MNKRQGGAYSAIYTVNVVFQAIFTLVWQVGLALLIGYGSVKWLSAPSWIYVPLIILGVITGLFSMVKFILGAMRSLDRIEEERQRKYREALKAKEKQKNE